MEIISNTLTAIEMINKANVIGINENILESAIKKGSKKFNKKYNLESLNRKNLIDKISSMTDDKDFINKIFYKLAFITDYGVSSLKDNIFKGQYPKKNPVYTLEISIGNNCITFKSSDGKTELTGKYQKNKHSSYIIYDDKKAKIYELNDKDSYNIESTKTIEVFNSNGIQNFRCIETTQENYYITKDTKEKILHDPNPLKNYTEKEYIWRETRNIILKKFIKTYTQKEPADFLINRECVLIGKNVDPSNKKIPYGGMYTWYDNELHQLYKSGTCSIDDVWQYKQGKFKEYKKVQ